MEATLWEKMKKDTRTPRPVEYVKDAKGKEIKFGRKLPRSEPEKKAPRLLSKANKPAVNLTNHERVIINRAAKMNITIAQYKEQFCGK